MRFGMDASGERICADDALRESEYLCPACKAPLILRRGKILAAHFAHTPKHSCIDTWTYDESDWKYGWQQKYPAKHQEVLISHSAQTHRADVAFGNYVLLFQLSPTPAKLFREKTKFFQNVGKTVFWIISVEAAIKAKALRENPKDRSQLFWDTPPEYLRKVDLKADRKLHIILNLGPAGLRKVEWIAPESGFKRFIIDGSFSPDILTEDGCQQAEMSKYARFDFLKEQNRPWHKKTASTASAQEKSWHICEKTGTWHLDRCKHCGHNLINEYRSANKNTNIPSGLFFYCCYPWIKHEMIAGENGKEKADVPSIWLK